MNELFFHNSFFEAFNKQLLIGTKTNFVLKNQYFIQ